MNQIVPLLLALPPYITYQGVSFELRLFPNGNEMRLVYALLNVAENSPHFSLYQEYYCWENPFIRPGDVYGCSFLYLVEGIESDNDLVRAVAETNDFLKRNNLLEQ